MIPRIHNIDVDFPSIYLSSSVALPVFNHESQLPRTICDYSRISMFLVHLCFWFLIGKTKLFCQELLGQP